MSRRSFLVAVALLAMSPACSMPGVLRVAKPKDGVAVTSASADLVYGHDVPEPAPPAVAALPAGVPLPTPTPALAAVTGSLADFFDSPSAPGHSFPPVSGTSPSACPEAGPATFPEKPARFAVEGQPAPGTYRWKQAGTFEVIGFTGKVPITGLTTREIRAVTLTPTTGPGGAGFTLSYEYVQTSLAGTETQTIEIRQSNAPSVPATAVAPSQGTDGVYLTRLHFAGGGTTINFHPSPLLAPKLMSLPLRSEVVNSTSTDVANGLVLQLNGQLDMSARVRIDACGEVADGWAFKLGTRVVRDAKDAQQAITSTTYDWVFAPQLGGLFIADHIVTQGNFGPLQYTSDVRSTIGGLRPRQ